VLIGLAVIGPALVLVLTLAVRRLVDVSLGPVAALTAEALALTAAEPERRLPEPPGTDEIATLARTLNGMLDRIDAAHRRERAFLDDAAHELRTPVAVLRAELELGLTSADHETARQALRAAVALHGRGTRAVAAAAGCAGPPHRLPLPGRANRRPGPSRRRPGKEPPMSKRSAFRASCLAAAKRGGMSERSERIDKHSADGASCLAAAKRGRA
jgi:hypothetical protein